MANTTSPPSPPSPSEPSPKVSEVDPVEFGDGAHDDNGAQEIVATPEELLQLAITMHQNGQREVAEKIYTDLLAFEPDNATALHYLGVARHQGGDDATALALLQRAIGLAPNDASLHINYGNVLVETGAEADAIPIYRRAAELGPDNPQPFNNVGVVLRALGKSELAEEAFRVAIAVAPRDPHAWHNLGNHLIAVGRAAEAIPCGLTAVTLMPPGRIDRSMLGAAYAFLGDVENARRVYAAWHAEDPDNPVPAHYLATLDGTLPDRASDSFVEHVFDNFASSFDAKLARLGYAAPRLVSDALGAALGGREGLAILDAGCGTGLCGPYLRPVASRLDGIDLSGKMLQRARRRGDYDRVMRIEIVAFLQSCEERYDAIVSADTLCYFGPLETFADAASAVLLPGGVLVATFEAANDPAAVELALTGRFRHGEDYLRRTFAGAGFDVTTITPAVLRTEQGKPVDGHVLTVQRLAGGR